MKITKKHETQNFSLIQQFDNCRQQVERRVEELGLTDEWAATIRWMRQVVAEKTVEPSEDSK
jgi:hypothetical protein